MIYLQSNQIHKDFRQKSDELLAILPYLALDFCIQN